MKAKILSAIKGLLPMLMHRLPLHRLSKLRRLNRRGNPNAGLRIATKHGSGLRQPRPAASREEASNIMIQAVNQSHRVDLVSVAELAAALRVQPQAIRKGGRSGRFGTSESFGPHVYAVANLKREDFDKLEAYRDARRRQEAIIALKDSSNVETCPWAQLDLTTKETEKAIAIREFLIWTAETARDQHLTIARAVMRAEAYAIESVQTCPFSALLGTGKGGDNQITVCNFYDWSKRWEPYRRHQFDRQQWWALGSRRREGAQTRSVKQYRKDTDARYWNHIALLYETLNGLSLLDSWNHTRAKGEREGWGECPTYRQVKYYYQRKADRAAVMARRKGEKFIYENIDVPARCDWSGLPLGSMWFADHHYCNNFVRVPKRSAPGFWYACRPTLTLFLDCPSLHVVGYIIRKKATAT